MKKNLLVFIAICFFAIQSRGQFPYASIWAGYPLAYELSSGFATNVTPGYFWLGYLSTVQNISTTWHINKNFCIMGTGASAIWSAYKVFDANACTGSSLTQVLNGYGVSAIETNGANGLRYALAGSYDKACYFTTLDSSGNVMSAMSYPFPHPPLNPFMLPSKPIIVESDNPNEYYICGSFETDMYIINVNASGTIIWSSYYSLGEGVSPKDIIMSPYNLHHLIVVGELTTSPIDKQGFFMDLDASTGITQQIKTYGNPGVADKFSTICLGSNIGPGNGSGFVIGGFTQMGPGGLTQQLFNGTVGGSSWVIKLDAGGNIIWNNIISPSLGINNGVIDIVERLNTFNNYEYYALLNASVGMQVIKLDGGGLPFPTSPPNAQFNEFVYDLPALIPSKPTSISYVNGPSTSPDVGIQMYGTASNFPGFSSSYVVSAYFNGETNCYRTLTTIHSSDPGPGSIDVISANQYGSFSDCSNFQVVAFFPGGSVNYPCSGLIPAGSNQRVMSAGVSGQMNNDGDFGVYPNPVTNKAIIKYAASDNSKVNIDVYNLLGEHITGINADPAAAGTYEKEVDFSTLKIESGVYFVTVKVDATTYKQKIIYTK
jgi:hypothetical protein